MSKNNFLSHFIETSPEHSVVELIVLMASLFLFDSERTKAAVRRRPNVEWGTGRPRPEINRPKSGRGTGTFLYAYVQLNRSFMREICFSRSPIGRGDPISQAYRNTDITLSNVRSNDEL